MSSFLSNDPTNKSGTSEVPKKSTFGKDQVPKVCRLFTEIASLRSNHPIQGTNILASDGAIGQHFNPDGAVGQIGEKVGGPLSKDGLIGSQFDASKQGVAGLVEKAVGGPKNDIKK